MRATLLRTVRRAPCSFYGNRTQDPAGHREDAHRRPLAAEVLDFITPHVKPGVTTGELDRLCHEYMVDVQGTIPAPLNYCPPGYTALPEVDLHLGQPPGLPWHPGRPVLKKGDIVNLDITVIKDGFHGDTSRMFYVGEPSIAARRLCDITYECMWLGIPRSSPARHLGDIGTAIQQHAESNGFSRGARVLRPRHRPQFHEEPRCCITASRAPLVELLPGMIFTIEPMINAGRREIRELADGWTIVTKDHSLSAQWEHTVLVTETGFEVLTVSPGMPAMPKSLEARQAA